MTSGLLSSRKYTYMRRAGDPLSGRGTCTCAHVLPHLNVTLAHYQVVVYADPLPVRHLRAYMEKHWTTHMGNGPGSRYNVCHGWERGGPTWYHCVRWACMKSMGREGDADAILQP